MSSPALETRPLHEICRALGSGGLGSGVSKSWCKKALPGVFPSPLEFDSTPTPGTNPGPVQDQRMETDALNPWP